MSTGGFRDRADEGFRPLDGPHQSPRDQFQRMYDAFETLGSAAVLRIK
ncbi:Uncharacterised protein [Mycobacteroides abscessus subsp. abscessus]|nr:Uncharacterised protein [Mycobacteroides abscessus subsp. abscessus]